MCAASRSLFLRARLFFATRSTPRARLRLHWLEERATPTTYTVNATSDTGSGSGDKGDLRYVIGKANANSGADTIVFDATVFGSATTITLTSDLTTITGAVTVNGPGAGNLSVNGAGKYRVFDINDGVSTTSLNVQINDLTIASGSTGGNGGGVRTEECVTLNGCAVSDCSAGWYGGGVYAGSGQLALSSSTITGNTALSGAGICSLYGGLGAVTNCTITNNVGGAGGGVFAVGGSPAFSSCTIGLNDITERNVSNNSGGGVFLSGCTATFTDCLIAGNVAGSPTPYVDPGHGGGIYAQGCDEITLDNCELSGNSATGNGGAVYAIFGGELRFENCTVSGNTAPGSVGYAAGYGGGVAASYCNSLEFVDCTLERNEALQGGAIAALYTDLTVESSTIGSAKAGDGNTALNGGGGVWAENGTVAIGDSTVTQNEVNGPGTPAPGNGGGIQVRNCDSVTLNGCTVSDNSATGNGGGIEAFVCDVIELEECTVSGNAAGQDGGGINAYSCDQIDLNDCTVSTNSAVQSGGGIATNDTSVGILGSILNDNIADVHGGAVDVTAGSLTAGGSEFKGNAAGGNGGGVRVTDSDLFVSVCDIASAAGGDGGGLYIDAPGEDVEVIFTKFTRSNGAGDNGGGVRLVDGDLTMHGCAFTESAGAAEGGAIYANGGTLTVTSSDIRGAADVGNGGGIFTTVPTTLTGSIISGEAAVYGGGIYAKSCTVTVSESTVTGAGCGAAGGGIFGDGSSTISVTSSTITGNSTDVKTGTYGGGIYSLGTLSVSLTTISSNFALRAGGGIYAKGGLTLSQSTVSDNTCNADSLVGGSDGGGILAAAGATITGSTINSNKAFFGGGIRFTGGSASVSNCTITDNQTYGDDTVKGSGGGISFGGSGLTVNHSTIARNTSYENGGGIAGQTGSGAAVVSLFGTLIGDNVSSQGTHEDASGDFLAKFSFFTNATGINFSTGSANNIVNPASGLSQAFDFFGGPTKTIPLTPSSVAVDGGDTIGLTTYDQRGGDGSGPLPDFDRVIKYNSTATTTKFDIGAFEIGVLPRVVGVQTSARNDGTELSYSRINSIKVTFDQPVSLPTPLENAFALVAVGNTGGYPNGAVTFAANGGSTPGVEPVLLTFSGTLTDGTGSLVDARYRLTVNKASVSTGQGNMASDFVYNFTRFFGDADNDADVYQPDAIVFDVDYYVSGFERVRFDFDGDTDVDGADALAFANQYAKALP